MVRMSEVDQRELQRSYTARWRADNPDRAREYSKAYRENRKVHYEMVKNEWCDEIHNEPGASVLAAALMVSQTDRCPVCDRRKNRYDMRLMDAAQNRLLVCARCRKFVQRFLTHLDRLGAVNVSSE